MTIATDRAQNAATDATSLIEARGLTKHYNGFSLHDVSFTVEEGEIVGFVGKNGAGKSTTIKALLGLIALDGGAADILGYDAATLARPSGAALKERIGVVFDTVSMPGHLTVSDVASMYARAFRTWDHRQFQMYLDRFDLPARKAIRDLSRGMGMKLSLACALSHDACLLVLDEATAGLDPMARDEVLDLLRAFVAEPGRAVFMSSHITTDLDKIADRIIGIDAGRIIFDRYKDEITDTMGVARCRVAEFEAIAASGIIPERELRYLRHDYGIDVLVPDRFAFAENFPNVPCDRMTIDDYLTLTLKGGVR